MIELSAISGQSSESRIDADLTDFADFGVLCLFKGFIVDSVITWTLVS